METKKLQELRSLSEEELLSRVKDAQQKLFELKMQKLAGQLDDTAASWRFRKEIARMKTLLGEHSSRK